MRDEDSIIPRGKIIGKQVGGPPLSEAEHYFKCEACGGWFDMRDLGAVLDHEEPLPHPACDQAQVTAYGCHDAQLIGGMDWSDYLRDQAGTCRQLTEHTITSNII
jgi:hypothetical protein